MCCIPIVSRGQFPGKGTMENPSLTGRTRSGRCNTLQTVPLGWTLTRMRDQCCFVLSFLNNTNSTHKWQPQIVQLWGLTGCTQKEIVILLGTVLGGANTRPQRSNISVTDHHGSCHEQKKKKFFFFVEH